MFNRRLLVLLGFHLSLGVTASGQILVRNGGVPSPQAPQVTQGFTWLATENLRDVRAMTHLAWSPDGKTGLEVHVPFTQRRVENVGPVEDPDAAGLGDVELTVQRSLRQDDAVMASERWALFAKLRLPTGDDRALRGPGGFLPKLLQPGMGSVGLEAGGVWSLIRDRHRFSASISGTWNDEADGFRMGSEIRAGLAYWFRLRPAVFGTGGFETEVRPVLECLLTQRIESENNGSGTGDDGLLAWIAPGLQFYLREDFLIQVSVALPFVNEIDDPLGRRDVSGHVSLRWYL
jgi:hypothetical protein